METESIEVEMVDLDDSVATNSSMGSTDTEEFIDLGDDDEEDLEIVRETEGSTRSLRSGTRAAAAEAARAKCSVCRQRLGEVRRHTATEGAGAEQVIADTTVNIAMDAEDGQALQYKLTDFAVYDSEGHLVPIFAESLLSRYKQLFLSGRVLRVDMEESEEGLRAASLGPITQWNNATGIEGGENNVIISMVVGEQELEFNLVRPSEEYLPLYENTFRMIFMANRIIVKLLAVTEAGGSMEYSELLEFLDSLEAPVLGGRALPRWDD